tara:strand:+ start:28418 stop:29614 length:1197 start_codon:yes stop_codon:yes gene_type:complete
MSEIRVDTISESTSGNGVVIDGATIKDGEFVGAGATAFRNKVINGNMAIAQRATAATNVSHATYQTVDRWTHNFTANSMAFTQAQVEDAPVGYGLKYSLKYQCTTADTSLAATDRLMVYHKIEDRMLDELNEWGTSNARSFTISFWVKAYVTGVYQVNVWHSEASKYISNTYTISSAGTWEYKTLNFVGNQADSAPDEDADEFLQLEFVLVAGSNYTGGTMVAATTTTYPSYTANTRGANQAVNLASSTSNYWQITGVQFEIGGTGTNYPTATDFEQVPHDIQEQRCMRYYQQIPHVASSSWQATPIWGINSNVMSGRVQLPVIMRSAPTGAFVGTRNTDFKAYYNGGYQTLTNEAATDTTVDSVRLDLYSSGAFAANDSGGVSVNTTDGRITLNAEL